VLKLLSVVEASPVAQSDNLWVRTANPFSIDSQRIQRLTKNRQAEWQTMQDYMTSKNCLMEFLSKSLDDPNAGSCGRCAVCVGRPLLPTIPNDRTIRKAIAFVKRSEVPFEPRKRWESQAFSAYNSWRGNIPLSLRVEQGRALSLWGDVGWARLVKENSEAGHFSDELVQACAEMVRSRWLPDPYPGWVTCVPSLRNPSLVRNFAQRLATSLEIPFVDVVSKVLETERQRSMMNGWQQAHNLDGAFAVNRDNVLDSAVLLVDDVVDSRWSMTIIGALLRQAGTGPVFPLALSLASASSG
jgi:ATP-dependent DNA helicase RecQ